MTLPPLQIPNKSNLILPPKPTLVLPLPPKPLTLPSPPKTFFLPLPVPKPSLSSAFDKLSINCGIDELIETGVKTLKHNQRIVLNECTQLGSGGLDLPMGYGKTRISILVALMNMKKLPNSRILVICAKTLIGNWVKEIKDVWGNSLSYEVLHQEQIKNLSSWTPRSNIVLTTPEIMTKAFTTYNVENIFTFGERETAFAPEIKYYRVPDTPYLSMPSGIGLLYSIKWGTIIIDEAHTYQNIGSKRCLAMSSLSAHHRWALSGTLLAEPKPPKLFGYHLLINHPTAPRNLPGFTEYIYSPDFKGIRSTLVKRDKNEDYIPPEINKQVISHSITETEALIYTNMKGILNVLKQKLREYKANDDKVNVKKFSSYIMAMISHLRQCLISPLIPVTSVAIDVADFEQRSELSEMFMNKIYELGINDWLNNPDSLCSSRIQKVIELVNKHPNEKIIIFSCFRTVIDVLQIYLPKDRPIFTISGNDKIDKRNQIIDQCKNSENGIFLMTYEIGGQGLNLQFASTVILTDFWWNDAKSNQAASRILRPGQLALLVHIYYLTANTGMENALFNMHVEKLTIGEEVMDGAIKSGISKIKVDDIIRMVNEDDNVEILNSMLNKRT